MNSSSTKRIAPIRETAAVSTKRTGCKAVLNRFGPLLLLLVIGLSPFVLDPPIAAQAEVKTAYVCLMDTGVRATRPGKCPKCGMALRREVAEPPAAAVETTRPDARSVGKEATLNLGRVADTTVFDQHGNKLLFYRDLVKGKTVAINFLFTTCTTICPPLAATFRKVQQELGDRVGREVNLISISVDPATDVPQRLNTFAAKFNAGPGWSFVTGTPSEIDRLLKLLGAGVSDKNDHTPMVLVGNEAAGYWTRTYGLAAPRALVKVIADAMGKTVPDATDVQIPLPAASSASKTETKVERRIDAAVANSDATGTSAQSPEAKPKTPAESAAAYFPNTVLYTQDNRPVHFFDDLLKGKTVMINFMFTTCTGICPPMTANLLKVQAYLGDRVGKDITIISISVDPAIDSPAELKKYATNYKVKPGWYFLTGHKAEVDLVLRKVGGFVKDKNEHSGLVMIGNVETGEWLKMFAMAKPVEIADAVLKVAGSKQ